MKQLPFLKILQDLEEFLKLCSSIGLHGTTGRFPQYRNAIGSLMDAIKTDSLSGQDEAQQDKYHVALMEGTEVSLMLPYLQQCELTAVSDKIKECLKGPFKSSDEKTSSNHPRNIQFELFLANILWQAEFQPVLGLHPDLKCRVGNRWFFFECKRLFSPSPQTLRDRIDEAAKQIHRNRTKAPPGTRGIIAVSLSRVFNCSQAVQPILNEQQGRQALDTWLMNKANEVRYDADGTDTWEPLIHKKIAGILFYVAAPFEDFEANLYTPGRYFKGIRLTREGSPDDLAMRELEEAMKTTQY